MNPEDFLQLVKKRRSCRSYLEKDISEDDIKFCLESARHAPSACNKQPWKFIIVKDKELRNKICSDGLLPGLTMPWLAKAPVIIVICAETSFITHKLAPVISGINYYPIDIGIAGEHFVLAAEALGIGTCWIGWFKEKAVKRILKIPGNVKIVTLISMGYQAEPTEKQAQKKSIPEICFYDNWNNSLS